MMVRTKRNEKGSFAQEVCFVRPFCFGLKKMESLIVESSLNNSNKSFLTELELPRLSLGLSIYPQRLLGEDNGDKVKNWG
jgi:hypothetical protein